MTKTTKIAGKRVGTKRSDKRWQSPDGQIWDSQFEYIVYTAYKASGYAIRRCTPSDTIPYIVPVRSGTCLACGATEVGKQRKYTPDFHVTPKDSERKTVSYYIETKGYLRPPERALLRALCKTQPDISLRLIFQRNYRVSKPTYNTDGSVMTWAQKFLKSWPASVWTGKP